MISSRALVCAIEISEGPEGFEHRELCNNLFGEALAMPIILYLSDHSGKTFQAVVQSDTAAA